MIINQICIGYTRVLADPDSKIPPRQFPKLLRKTAYA
jgi:hypothetical protein